MGNKINKQIITITKDNNSKILFNYGNQEKIELNINSQGDKNSFDKLFDFIICELTNFNEVIVELDDNTDFSSDSRINEIIKGLKDLINKEIEEIVEDIKNA